MDEENETLLTRKSDEEKVAWCDRIIETAELQHLEDFPELLTLAIVAMVARNDCCACFDITVTGMDDEVAMLRAYEQLHADGRVHVQGDPQTRFMVATDPIVRL